MRAWRHAEGDDKEYARGESKDDRARTRDARAVNKFKFK